jgi:hypothetical protein
MSAPKDEEKHGFLINMLIIIIDFAKEIPEKFMSFGNGTGSKVILVCLLLAVFSLLVEFLFACGLGILYLSKLASFNSIKNPLIIDSPNFSIITEGKLNYGIIIGLAGLSFFLSAGSLFKVFAVQTSADEKEFVLVFGVICILSIIIQIPIIVKFYMNFLKNNNNNTHTINNINQNIYEYYYKSDDRFISHLTVQSSNKVSLNKNIETCLNDLFSSPNKIEIVFNTSGNIRDIIYSINMYINYHTMMGYTNENLKDALSTFNNVGRIRSLVSTVTNINPINYFSLYTPYLIDNSSNIGNMLLNTITETLKKAQTIPEGNSSINDISTNVETNQKLSPTQINDLINKYKRKINSEIRDSSHIISNINADLSNLDMTTITNSYEDLIIASIFSQVPFPILMGIFVKEDSRNKINTFYSKNIANNS